MFDGLSAFVETLFDLIEPKALKDKPKKKGGNA